MLVIDHLLWAAPDLEAGAALFAELSGVTPAKGGSHPGFGTRNCLVALDQGAYFEVIAPDPAQNLDGNLGGFIAARPAPWLYGFALQSNDLPGLERAARAAGIGVEGPVAMTRTRTDGVKLAWSILYLRDVRFEGVLPFAIDWGDSPHPSASTPTGCTLRSFAALHPDADALADIYARLGIPVPVKRAAAAGFIAELGTPRGDLVLAGQA